MKKPRIKITEKQKPTVSQVVINLYDTSLDDRIILDTPGGYHFEVSRSRGIEDNRDTQSSSTTIDKLVFNEAYQYLENAKIRLDTKTATGYSDCKANCRNALMSALKTLTGKGEVSEAARELGRQGILGKREKEFTETFNKLLVILHGLDSKKGSHPPMERNEDDAELALNITTGVVNYLINQATKPRD